MTAATNTQVQHFVDERFRPFAEAAKALLIAAQAHRSLIDDVYAACAAGSPTWTDQRTDGPPHLLVPNDVLAWNSFMANLITYLGADGDWAVVQKACVRV